jgi:hypothetical protein
MVVQVVLTSMAVLQAAPFPSSNLSRDLVAFFAGRQSGARNSGFKCDLAAASKAGHIVYPDASTVRLTPEGLASLGTIVGDPPQSNDDIHDYLIQGLEGHRTKQLVAFLADGQPHSRESAARELGFRSAQVRSCTSSRLALTDPSHRSFHLLAFCTIQSLDTDVGIQVLLRQGEPPRPHLLPDDDHHGASGLCLSFWASDTF